MTRFRADLLLLFATLIWGTAFVAQKQALEHVGPFSFVAVRFLVSLLVVLPLALREGRRERDGFLAVPSGGREVLWLCLAFAGGAILQQAGIAGTSVTNAGFLTGLYVLFTPLLCRALWGQRVPWRIWPAALLSVAGVWLLSGGTLSRGAAFSGGDVLVILCALAFAAHIALMGRVMGRANAPFRVCLAQYAVTAAVAGVLGLAFEDMGAQDFRGAFWPLLYAGTLSGGVAFTIQAVAQRYTPAPDSAVILSAEAVFAALAGAVLMHERVGAAGLAGCGLIFAAILLVEAGGIIFRRFSAS